MRIEVEVFIVWMIDIECSIPRNGLNRVLRYGRMVITDVCLHYNISTQIEQMSSASKYEGIVVTSKAEYSCAQKLFCCKCFSCLQEETVMTSDIRKETIQRMIQDYMDNDNATGKPTQQQILIDPVKLMILIYVCNDDSIPNRHIERCKINPSTGVINYRTDLQFYVPQLCNYIVFHRSLQNNYLKQAIEKMCKLNYYFAHLYYFYMKSLEKNITKTEIQVLRPVIDYNNSFIGNMGQHYKDVKLTCLDLYIDEHNHHRHNEPDDYARNVIFQYQTSKVEYGKLTKVKGDDIILNKYRSIFEGDNEISTSFQSILAFFQDLFFICDQLKKYSNKKQKVIEYVKMMNEYLPSTAYVPFSKNSYRLCNILKIVTSEVKIYSTKERAPVCLCIETYCQAEELNKEEEEKFWVNVQTPITLKMMSFENRSLYFARNFQRTAEFKRHRQSSSRVKVLGAARNILQQQRMVNLNRQSFHIRQQQKKKARSEQGKAKVNQLVHMPTDNHSISVQTQNMSTAKEYSQRFVQKQPRYYEVQLQRIEQRKQQQIDWRKTAKQVKTYSGRSKQIFEEAFDHMFGEPLINTRERIKKNSVFGNLKSWDIIYVIIKTQDDLKQEQFAMQLIQQFDYIFKLEELPLILTTYEVMSMGADRGIIEVVKDSVTFDSLQKTLKTGLPVKTSLKEFFQIYYQDDLAEAKLIFMKSLAAYSLVMYILQAKDRHNGNILLHRSGKMFHIDFGFFLSNLPGNGIELERDCPFKLLTEHVEVLDGHDSYYFKKFREYFFLGFKAIRKHQNKVLMLVKLMYSTSGMTMPCFSKGEATITAMENRINPPGMTNDSLLNEHCQRLINLSLDNWASKWYDRFQYWAQGIFY